MYGSILTFLIAIVIQALAPRGPAGAWTLATVAPIVLFPLAIWAALRVCFRRLMRRALHSEAEAHRLRASFAQLVQSYQTLLLVPFALFTYLTPYPALILEPVSRYSEVFGNALGVAPFGLSLVLLWWEAYPLQGVLFGRSGTRARFAASHARMEFPVLVPWLFLMGILDVLRYAFPRAHQLLEANPVLQLLYAPLFLFLVGVFLPILVKAMWGCEPVPAGPLRQRLAAFCTGLGLRVEDILFWPLLEGKVMTAGIFGLLPRFRYLLVTPAIAEVLTPEELEGVVAHEAGHVRHGHLWFYLFFFVGYLCLVAVFSRLAEAAVTWWGIAEPEALRQPRANLYISIATTLSLLAILFFYFRILFGAVSRAFERQADAYALTALGHAGPLVSALERISYYSGDIRDLPSWHHGSIAERVEFLERAVALPGTVDGHGRYVRRIEGAFALAVIAFGFLAVSLHTGPLNGRLNLFVGEQGLLRRVQESPTNAKAWLLLAYVYQEAGRERDTERAYQRVIELDPNQAEALNNLAWLYITTSNPELYRPERALALAEIAARLAPSPDVLDTLAEARYRVHDYRGAVEAIEAALTLKPRNRQYFLGQQQKFREALRKAEG
jgi:Zn-dependent protease with chaperone function